MSAELAHLFWAMVLFQVKHFICDFVIQTKYQLRNKGTYGHPGGLLHSGLHGIMSVPAVALLTGAPLLIVGLPLAEAVVHYHVDWTKAGVTRLSVVKDDSNLYWALFGADQFVHQATYLVMLGLLVRLAA